MLGRHLGINVSEEIGHKRSNHHPEKEPNFGPLYAP